MSKEMSEFGDDSTVLAQPVKQSELFDLRILSRELWRWKWLLLFIALVGAAKGVLDARDFVPMYKAQMTVEPNDEGNFIPRVGSGSGFLGAAQSFGLIRGNVGQITKFEHFKQAIGSRKLAGVLQSKYGLLQKIYSGSWNSDTKAWIQPKADVNSIRFRVRQYFHYNSPQPPNIGTLANYVGSIVRVESLQQTPFFEIIVEHRDRNFALYLLEIVYKEADQLLGERDRREQARDRQYVEGQLKKSQLAEVRTNLLAMLMQQEQKAMLINSKPPFTINVLEIPWVSRQPKEPNLAKIIGLPFAIALAISFVILTLFVSFRME